jgi:DNA-binding SARP family transcriptional activator
MAGLLEASFYLTIQSPVEYSWLRRQERKAEWSVRTTLSQARRLAGAAATSEVLLGQDRRIPI